MFLPLNGNAVKAMEITNLLTDYPDEHITRVRKRSVLDEPASLFGAAAYSGLYAVILAL
jgi:hypothetical protein